jgi:hypothetical protein
MMAGYFMTPKRIRPTKYYWLIPDDLVIPDRPLGRVAHVRGKDGQLQDVMVLYVTKQKQRQLQDGRVIPDQFMIEFTNQYASSVQVKQGQRTERKRQKDYRGPFDSAQQKYNRVRKVIKRHHRVREELSALEKDKKKDKN